METEKTSKRTRRVLKAIEDAVFVLLGEKEFEYITAQDIYQRANVNKATFYKYNKSKYDALAKAFTSRINEEYNAEIAKRAGEIESMGLDEANYQALMFIVDFFERYRAQFAHLVSDSGDLPKDIVFSALFANYRHYFSSMIGKDVTRENEYIVHFVFGAFRSIYECHMQKMAKDPNEPSRRQDIEKACHIVAKTFSILHRALLDGDGEALSSDAK